MVNINGSNNINDESHSRENDPDITEFNNLILTIKAADYINIENQENLSRVHVLCCNKCDYLTISLKALQQHMILLHSLPSDEFNNITIYSCQECKCVSTELKLIKEHIKIFHNTLMEKSSLIGKSAKVVSVLSPSVHRNNRKITSHIKLGKTQLKIRKKILQRKSLKVTASGYTDNNNINNNDTNNCTIIRKENIKCNDRIEMSQDVNENDPLDMSINSTMCPFKGIKCEATESSIHRYAVKLEALNNENLEQTNHNNALLSNPQTCIELIKLTLNQMLNKSAEQNRLSHIGFNPASFIQPQFQLSQNLVPLLLPATSQSQNTNSTSNEMSFVAKNPELEAILSNFHQQNLFNNTGPNNFDQNTQVIGYQQSPLIFNHKLSATTANVTKALYIDSGLRNGNFSVSTSSAFNSKKSTDFQNKSLNKRSLKKQQAPTKLRNGLTEENNYLQNTKFESPKGDTNGHENLFNRSFLDTTELETTNDSIILSKTLDENDNIDVHINMSNKSSPNTLTNDKPHRQNFTSQQNRILSDWFFTHCDKPYPSTEDTKELSLLSGLTYSQVKKWFANKRARSSLNKKNHKNYCLITPEENTNNDLLSISPSSESNRSYTNHNEAPEAIDFTTSNQDDFEQRGN